MELDEAPPPLAVSRMLVVGNDVTAQHGVLTQLHALCGQQATVPSTNATRPLALSTKYYTATVDVHAHEVHLNEPAVPLAHELHDYEAVLCVLDTPHDESFAHVSRFLAQLAASPIEVRLVVALDAPAAATPPRHLERLQTWCIDNEFELVVITTDSNSSTNSSNSGKLLDDHEKHGIDRVLEALHCTMWASMVPRTAPLDASASRLHALADVSVGLAASDDANKQPPVSVKSNVEPIATDDDAATGNVDDDERLQTLLRALEITEASSDVDAFAALPPPTKATTDTNSNLLRAKDAVNHDDDDDIDMHEFSALISEVRRVRDTGQELSDEQRRQRAAEVAMKLWSFLGDDDDDEDE